MERDRKYYEKFKTETVYLYNSDAEIYIRSVPGEGFFGKFPGGRERPIDADSDAVTFAIHGGTEITKTKYEKA